MTVINICSLLSLFIHVTRQNVIHCPVEFCTCADFDAVCSGKNLTYIPRFPKNVKIFTFLNGNIGTLSKKRTANLTFNNILKLNFKNNSIRQLEADTFSNFTSIVALTISSEPLLLATIVMHALNNMETAHFRSLTLTGNNWSFLPHDMFKAINMNKIHDININSNNLQVLNMSWFSNMTRLQYLKVSYNKIATIIPDRVSSLEKLYLDGNEITKFQKFCINHGNSALPSLRYLSLSNNKIGFIGQFRCFPRLKILKISDNLIGRIDNNTFTDLKMLTNLSLQAIGKQLKKIEDGALNIPSLQMLSLRYCNFHFESLSVSEQSSMLSSCNNLEHLDLGGNFLQSTILPRIISPLKQLRYLNLENTRLGFLPAYVFPELPMIETLIMSENRIYGCGRDVFAPVVSLQYLDLRHNLIRIVNETSFPTALLANFKTMNLAKNPFTCTCEQIWFVSWLRQANITLLQYPNHYHCTTPDNYNGVLLKDYKPSVLSCNPIFLIVISISALVCLLVSTMIIFLKCNTNVKNFLYLLKVKQFRRQGYLPIVNSDDYEYHAFVVYCDENRIWVHDQFVKKLENNEGFKFCIYHRDFDVGESISGNVDKFLKNSWKVVVIISNAFAKSEWCQWEVDIIQERRRRQGRDALLLVMLENITSTNMTSPLRTLLDSTPHLRYKKGIGENLFWTAVVEDLRKAVGQPPISEL
ncbi:toll-like receptor 3 [Mytilus californianus]|uniref:toll-like receptor 3 n=1 Tax=Mytilus californianus TaxID=6549 RepID=UPI002246ABAF|nr:toll-like receptor 3 [Mytilus californianus]